MILDFFVQPRESIYKTLQPLPKKQAQWPIGSAPRPIPQPIKPKVPSKFWR